MCFVQYKNAILNRRVGIEFLTNNYQSNPTHLTVILSKN